jgi:hypothetical protein
MAGTALRSSVFRVDVSNVRIPRSQKITFGFPWDRMYSPARSRSSIVDAMPRLSTTGFRLRPSASSRRKFCMFLVPT